MNPIDLLKPSVAISPATPEAAVANAQPELPGTTDPLADGLTRAMLIETISSMLSAPGDDGSGEPQAADPAAALIGMLLDSSTKASVL